jgi:hypothetical protein
VYHFYYYIPNALYFWGPHILRYFRLLSSSHFYLLKLQCLLRDVISSIIIIIIISSSSSITRNRTYEKTRPTTITATFV